MAEEVLRTSIVDFTIDRITLPWGQSVKVSGRLIDELGRPVPNMLIEIQQFVVGKWVTIATVKTNARGYFSETIELPVPGYYEFRAFFRGTRIGQIYEPTLSPTVGATAEKHPSTITGFVWSSPTRFNATDVKGQSCSLKARIWCDTCWGLAGKTLKFWRATTLLGSVTTDTDGWGSFGTVHPVTVGDYRYWASWDGDDLHTEAADGEIATIEARTPLLSLDISPKTVIAGGSISWFGGMVDPKVTTYGIVDKDIYLQESVDKVTWYDVAGPVKTGADGKYSGSYTVPTVPGTYYYRSRFPGGSSQLVAEEAVSPELTIQVVAELPPPAPIPAVAIAGIALTTVGALGLLALKKKRS